MCWKHCQPFFRYGSKALDIANEQLGGQWRLPSQAELKSIVCKECSSPKINEEIFPNTDNAPYWTGDQSIFNKVLCKC